MTLILAIVELLARLLLPMLFPSGESKPKVSDAMPQTELRKRLTDRIVNHWGAVLIVLMLATGAAGCTRTVYVSDGEPVRLRETVKNVKVWIKDADGNIIAGRVDLLEGGYYLTLPPDEVE